MAQFPSTSSASGLWSLTDVRNNLMGSNWPSTIVPTALTVEYLVVAGGGGGGAGYYGGGGGAGGYRTDTGLSVSSGSAITVTIGAGGAISSSNPLIAGNSGSDSTFSAITSIGGGGGGSRNNSVVGGASNGKNGGSGGGTAYGEYGGNGTAGQGNNGGAWVSTQYGTSGGGAGAVGTGQASQVASPGGVGLQSSISGTGTYYAGGGGGGKDGVVSSGGLGGGGSGGTYQTTVPTAGGTNTGGGGGGGGNAFNDYVVPTYQGAAGGSGIVIIRYADTSPAATATTGSPTITTAGGYRVYKWTSSGSITF